MSPTYWWCKPEARRGTPALFLDRDGVGGEEVGYLGRPDLVRRHDGAREVVAAAAAGGWAVGLVTNQSGVGRGLYGWADFEAVQREIERQLGLGSVFDFVAACGAHPEASRPELRIADHPWRKPRPGMFLAAADALRIDLPASLSVGDTLSDVQAAAAAGVGRIAHLLTGHGREARPQVVEAATRLGAHVELRDDLRQVLPMLPERPAPIR
jgi:D-glycero-D-manno-heptose 1,7-bisphosphate phosphatase